MRPWLFLASLGLSCAFVVVDPATAQTYKVTDLGNLPGYQSISPTGINEAGDVTGTVVTSPDPFPVSQAFLYHDGKLETIDGANSMGSAISGGTRKRSWPDEEERTKLRVTGSMPSLQNEDHAFLYEDHFVRDLGTLPGGTQSIGSAVNSFGDVAGEANDANNKFVAVLFKHGNVINLGTLPDGYAAGALGINNLGDVTGSSEGPAPSFDQHAFLYHHGEMFDLGKLPGADDSEGFAINDFLQVTGLSFSDNLALEHAFLWSKGKLIDLGTLPNSVNSIPGGINDWGEVVGESDTSLANFQGTSRAFFYSDRHMYDLNDMIPANSGWVLNTASDINNRGQITGNGTFQGVYSAYLLTPDCNDSKKSDCDFCRHYR
jgi:probable HAF family extracellular repeat protein